MQMLVGIMWGTEREGPKLGFDILFALYHPNLDAKLTLFYYADKTDLRD